MTVHERVAAARHRLGAAGIGAAEAAASARLLAEHILGWDTTHYLVSGNDPEPPDFVAPYDAAVARRAAREPSAYITGRQEFWGLSFDVTPAVLIPRSETELIVEGVLDIFGARRQDELMIADVCTGCGNLAIALASELPNASFIATDISDDALTVARRNAERLGTAERVQFVCTHVLDGIDGQFDAIVANPPYVRAGDGPALQPEVRDHEPGVALYGGPAGTELVAAVIEQAVQRLQPEGWLLFEFGFGQEVAIETMIQATPGLTLREFRRDLQGLARTAICRRA